MKCGEPSFHDSKSRSLQTHSATAHLDLGSHGSWTTSLEHLCQCLGGLHGWQCEGGDWGNSVTPWVFPNLLLPTSLPQFLMSFFTQRWNGSGGEHFDQSEAVMKFTWSKSWKGDRECLQDGGRCPGRGPGPHWGHCSWRGRWAHPVDWRVSPLRGQWEMKMKFGC